jgi:hypothetical protein
MPAKAGTIGQLPGELFGWNGLYMGGRLLNVRSTLLVRRRSRLFVFFIGTMPTYRATNASTDEGMVPSEMASGASHGSARQAAFGACLTGKKYYCGE